MGINLEIANLVSKLEAQGKVTRTFRRLDLNRQMTVIDAIFSEALEAGPANLNIKRVAGRAGIALGSLYQYFGSRAGLMDFAIELVVYQTNLTFSQYRDVLTQLPLREALEGYMLGGLEWSKQNLGFASFYAKAAYGGDPELVDRVVRPIADTMREMVTLILAAAQERGEIKDGVDLGPLSRVLHALSIALIDPILMPELNAYFQITGQDSSPEQTLSAALDMVLSGIRAEERRTNV